MAAEGRRARAVATSASRAPRSAEPWAIAITLLFTGLIAVCVGFWTIAEVHPDEELALQSMRDVLESQRAAEGPDER